MSHPTDCCLIYQYGKSHNLRPIRSSVAYHTLLALQTWLALQSSLGSSAMPTSKRDFNNPPSELEVHAE